MSRMARKKARRAQEWWPLRDEHCPERGVGLSHIVDGTDQCVYCDQWTRKRETPTTIDGPDGAKSFTDAQVKTYEFYRHLYREGKV